MILGYTHSGVTKKITARGKCKISAPQNLLFSKYSRGW